MGPANKLLEAAAAPTFERIRQDRKKAPVQLQPLLAYLEEHLFDPDLDANQLKRACGVRDNSLPIYFHHALSLPPYAYIEDCRLEVACRLLRDTDLKVWQVAQLLGYSTLQVFSRAFDRWSGLRPSVFRRRARHEDQASGNGTTVPRGADVRGEDSLICLTTLRKAVSGGLSKGEADDLVRHLSRLYPDSFDQQDERHPAEPEVAAPREGAEVAGMKAEEAWSILKDCPPEIRSGLLRGRLRLPSVELVDLLIHKGIESVRRDARQGVEIAALAADCVAGLAGSVESSELRRLEVRAYSWLASAHRFVLDFPEAEKALDRAQRSLMPSCDADVRTEFTLHKSGLRMSQRRMDEALKLAEKAVTLLPSVKNPQLRVRGWLQRAHIFHVTGRIAESTADLWKAFGLVGQIDDVYLQCGLYQMLSYNLALDGKYQEATRYLPIARHLCDSLGLDRALNYLEWIEGLIEREGGNFDEAEDHFRAARAGFYEQEESYLGGLVALDLAMLCASEGRHSETMELASEAIKVFEGLRIRQEVLKAIQLLRQTMAIEQVTFSTLQKVRCAAAKNQHVSSP